MIMRTARRGKSFLHNRPARMAAAAVSLLLATSALAASPGPAWPQWGGNPQHTGLSAAVGQHLTAILADVVIDPFAPLESAEGFDALRVHYAVPLIDGADVYIEFKSGQYVSCVPPGSAEPFPCGYDATDSQIWNVKKVRLESGALVELWTFASDWKPEPKAGHVSLEPVFHPVLAGGFLYVPGLGGTVHRVSKTTGTALTRINPFGDLNPARHVAGGLAADDGGHVIYNVIELAPSDPWVVDVAGAWLVRVGPDDVAAKADFSSLVAGAPGPADACKGEFSTEPTPWPPSPTAVPPSSPCGSQRPGLNVVPAVAPDGTIYTVSRAHFNAAYAFLVAARPDLTPAWSASLRGFLNDGCGVLVPIDNSDTGCRTGANVGVDPATNDRPAGLVPDGASSSPVVLPDGTVLYGARTFYNDGRGHLFKFDSSGHALAAYDFGWDITPAVRVHDGTYSIVLKDNHYPGGRESERYDITSLDASLVPEWKFTATNTLSCARQGDGTITCVDDHPNSFEWCVNQPAVDAAGVSYGTSEDGYLYSIDSTGALREKLFLDLAIGAAYTPLSIGPDGRIYAQNNGHLFVVGVPVAPREHPTAPDHTRPGTRTLERP